MSSTDNDLPTLIEYLKSPSLIKPIANKYDISYENFIKNLNLESGGTAGVNKAKGILRVSYFNKNKKKRVKKIIKELSNRYLDTALEMRRKKLQDGLTFLNDQYPSLQKKILRFKIKFSYLGKKIILFNQKLKVSL